MLTTQPSLFPTDSDDDDGIILEYYPDFFKSHCNNAADAMFEHSKELQWQQNWIRTTKSPLEVAYTAAQIPGMILLVRLGDFYEALNDDAKQLAKLMELVITSKQSGDRRIPLTGVPYHAIDRYVAQLYNDHGLRVHVLVWDTPIAVTSHAMEDLNWHRD